jgi:uncharacterized protein (DUF433 family)
MPHQLAEGISSDPAILGGQPVIAGTRIPVDQIVRLYDSGMTMQDFHEGYHLSEAQVRAALIYAQQAKEGLAENGSHS